MSKIADNENCEKKNEKRQPGRKWYIVVAALTLKFSKLRVQHTDSNGTDSGCRQGSVTKTDSERRC